MPYDHWETDKQGIVDTYTTGERSIFLGGWMKYTHHIRLGSELLCLQAFDGHPFHRQLYPFVILNAVVLLVIYVPRHAKISNLDCEGFIQPEKRKHFKKIIPQPVPFQLTRLCTQGLATLKNHCWWAVENEILSEKANEMFPQKCQKFIPPNICHPKRGFFFFKDLKLSQILYFLFGGIIIVS